MNDKQIDLADLAKSLNKISGTEVASVHKEDMDTNVSEFIHTGSSELDIAISNRKHGGYPVGRIVELSGLEHSGKSMMCAIAIANTQKAGGIGVYFDTESSLSLEFFEMLGVDISSDKFMYVKEQRIEVIFQSIDLILDKLNSGKDKKLVTIVYDGHASSTTEDELKNKTYEKTGYNTSKPLISSSSFKRIATTIQENRALLIVTNQLRQKMNAMPFGDPYCVDPYTTKVSIRYKYTFNTVNDTSNDKWIYKTIPVEQVSNEFFNNSDLDTSEWWDVNPKYELQIKSHYFAEMDEEDTENSFTDRYNYLINELGYNKKDLIKSRDVYVPIARFFVKQGTSNHYTDGKLRGTSNHIVIDDRGNETNLKKHSEFNEVLKPISVVDFDIPYLHNYIANGRINHNTTTGGMALGFYASVRIRLKSTKRIKGTFNGLEQVIGILTEAAVVKTRLGPNYRNAKYNFYYDSGINDYENWLETLKKTKRIGFTGKSYIWTDTSTGEEIKFMRKDVHKVMEEHPQIKEQLYDALCDLLIVNYKSAELDESDITYSNMGSGFQSED